METPISCFLPSYILFPHSFFFFIKTAWLFSVYCVKELHWHTSEHMWSPNTITQSMRTPLISPHLTVSCVFFFPPTELGLHFNTQAFSSCGAWALEHMCSVVPGHGPSCFSACGILVPQPGIIHWCPLIWKVDSQPWDNQGSTTVSSLKAMHVCVLSHFSCA